MFQVMNASSYGETPKHVSNIKVGCSLKRLYCKPVRILKSFSRTKMCMSSFNRMHCINHPACSETTSKWTTNCHCCASCCSLYHELQLPPSVALCIISCNCQKVVFLYVHSISTLTRLAQCLKSSTGWLYFTHYSSSANADPRHG